MIDIVEQLAGPHEWGYRDVTDGTFIADDAPYHAAETITKLRAELARLYLDYTTANTGLLDAHRQVIALRAELASRGLHT